MLIRKIVLTLLTGPSSLALFAGTAQAGTDYYFGDSDLEQGNAQILADLPPAGRDIYYCEGGLCRDSNGPVWAELLTPGLQPALAVDVPSSSLNFAFSGAHITQRGDPSLPVPTGVSQQIALFDALRSEGAISVAADDRFFIHAGTNDLLRLLEGEDPAAVRADIVGAARDHITGLAAAGARTVVLAQVQPVQYLPFLGGAENAELRALAADFVASTNSDLAAEVADLRASLPAGTQLIIMDQPAFFEHLQRDFARLGFSSFDTPCLDEATGAPCSSDRAEQDRHVFFDPNHLSGAGHRLLADWYGATLHAGLGEANEGAGRMTDVILAGADEVQRQILAAQQMFGQPQDGTFLFAAPFSGTYVGRAEGSTRLRSRQRGGVAGINLAAGQSVFVALTAAFLDQQASQPGAASFAIREWSVAGQVGMALGAVNLAVEGGYARPRIRDFARDAGALGLVARGETQGTRYGGALALNYERRTGRRWLRLSSRLDYRHARIDGFSESGADGLSLTYTRQSAHALALENETRFGIAAIETPRFRLTPFINIRDRRLLSGDEHAATAQLGAANAPVSLVLSSMDGDAITAGGGVDLAIGRRVRLGLSYDHTLSGPRRDSGTGGLRLSFGW